MTNIQEHQRYDPFCSELLEIFQSGDSDRVKKLFILYNDVLFKRGSATNRGAELCIPESNRRSLVLQEHNEQGHYIVSGNTRASPTSRIVDEITSVPSTSPIIGKSTTARSTPRIISEAINVPPTSENISEGRRATLAYE
ncbi:hypothetical protein JTB14_005651 [Gonioctena quinquepunctata]|nr:hypothetical protein JTB14_005651 [Gonioctena quinquepunctata]